MEGPISGQNSIEFIFHYWVHRVHTVVSIQNAQTCAQSKPIKGNWSVPLVGQLYICILYTSIYLYTVYKDSYNWSQISRVGLWWGHAVILIYSWIEGGSAYDRMGLWTSIYGTQKCGPRFRIWTAKGFPGDHRGLPFSANKVEKWGPWTPDISGNISMWTRNKKSLSTPDIVLENGITASAKINIINRFCLF